MTTRQITPDTAQTMIPCELAQLLSTDACEIQFTGDMNPFDHGGTFYETSNWRDYGYASCVQFTPIEGRTLVTSGSIHRLNDEEMRSAHECCDTPAEYRDTTVGEIEACLGHGGCETDEDFSGQYAEWFDEDSESDAWTLALNWIRGLIR